MKIPMLRLALIIMPAIISLGVVAVNGCAPSSLSAKTPAPIPVSAPKAIVVVKSPGSIACSALPAEACTEKLVLQYAAAYQLLQAHADGTVADGTWTAEFGTITPDGTTYIAPIGQVVHDEDTLTYHPSSSGTDSSFYDVQVYPIVLSTDLGLPVDPRARECTVGPIPPAGTIDVEVEPNPVTGEPIMQTLPVVPIPMTPIGIEPVNQILVVPLPPALPGEYATAGTNARLLEPITLNTATGPKTGSKVPVKPGFGTVVPPNPDNPLLIAIGNAGINAKCIPLVIKVPEGACTPPGKEVAYVENNRVTRDLGRTNVGAVTWTDGTQASISAAVTWLSGIGINLGGGYAWNYSVGSQIYIRANEREVADHYRVWTYRCCTTTWKLVAVTHYARFWLEWWNPAPVDLLFWLGSRENFGWHGSNPLRSMPYGETTKNWPPITYPCP